MDLHLNGRKAVVTGSTAGIGFAIAQALATEGAEVVVNGRTAARVNDAVTRIQSAAPKAKIVGYAADLGTADGCAQLAADIQDVDILVNNVGIFEPKPFIEIPDADWMRFFETNVLSGVRLSRSYLPHMLLQKWGRIIFISSESALQIPAEMVHYGMTKTSQLAVMRGLAESVVDMGVTVNTVLPGPTRSEGVGQFVEDLAHSKKATIGEIEKQFFQTMRPTSLIKRFIEPVEVASLTTFLCSPHAAAITGTSLRVDGGVVRSIA